MLRRIYAQLFLASSVAFVAMPCLAWESEKPVPMPSPTGSVPNGLSMKEVTVDVKGSSVTTTYILLNKDDKPKTNVFAVYLPAFSWSGIASDYPDRHFPEFKVSSDGKKIGLGITEIALHDGREITRDLARAGLSPTRVGLGEEALLDIDKRSKGQYAGLIASGALQPANGVYLPKWHALVSYWWKQEYKPHKDTRIDLQYIARPGFFPISKNDKRLTSYIISHCGTEKDVEEIASGVLFKGNDDLLVKTFILPFKIGDLNLDAANLNYSSGKTEGVPKPALSYVCTNALGSGAKGNPSLESVKISNQDGVISVLVISGQ